MWTHLQLVNFCIGLQMGFRKLPTPFLSHGYDLSSIGRKFTLGDGTTLVPDLLLHAARHGKSLLLEAKSGTSVDTEQLRKYRKCRAADLRDRAFCHVPSPEEHSVDTLYVINDAHIEPVRSACTRAGLDAPFLCVSSKSFQLVGASLVDSALDEELREVWPVAEGNFPDRFFLPIDDQSKQGEAIDAVLAEVVAMLDKGITSFGPGDVVRRLVGNVNPEAIHQVRGMNRVVREILSGVAGNEFSDWLEPPGPQDLFKVKRSISRHDRPARTREIRSVRAAIRKAVARVRAEETDLPLFPS